MGLPPACLPLCQAAPAFRGCALPTGRPSLSPLPPAPSPPVSSSVLLRPHSHMRFLWVAVSCLFFTVSLSPLPDLDLVWPTRSPLLAELSTVAGAQGGGAEVLTCSWGGGGSTAKVGAVVSGSRWTRSPASAWPCQRPRGGGQTVGMPGLLGLRRGGGSLPGSHPCLRPACGRTRAAACGAGHRAPEPGNVPEKLC